MGSKVCTISQELPNLSDLAQKEVILPHILLCKQPSNSESAFMKILFVF